ncbi:DGQHR domain-containing protein [Puniceicoccales bacterium CK1056]|uniref:DGQHR domain-containing protein n=1 Tax=Oceanipulchritudo coccoides TaxID=2706888 RepID=A0A6B2LY40_9BACT|nr:DGQHR domain-containing protein [Oceanipulchritudo coccoides]NDV60969.1 DGQHR domain-containing protein [Oceanipulchritudo coccoides]
MPDAEWLKPIVSDSNKLKREAARRRKPHQQDSVAKSVLQAYLDEGWEEDIPLKIKVRIKKPWTHDEKLENFSWYLMYLLGYPEISSGRNFQVKIQRKGAEPFNKQIDVLAKDEETVIVTECKSSARITKKSLQKDIEEFASLQKPISNAIKKHYGNGFKPKIIWLFITHNIAWSKPDRERAAGSNINIITEKELRYYLQIADHLRSAARFQFLAEFLKNQKIPEMDDVKVPAVKGKLGGKTFYSFVSTPKQMLKIAFVNHRSLNDPAGAPSYQRLVSRTRLRQISKFIHGGGFFPTNILVNFTAKSRFEQIAKDEDTNVAFGKLYLPCKYRSAWIIDGQHRLYGFAPLSEKHLNQNIMVVAFEGLKKEEEANLFVTINHEQKSVPKTLLDDLEGELKWGSDKPTERIGAISARLIGYLNNDIGEPLYGRVTQQGIAPTEKTCLTVPALKDGIRKSGLVGEAILKKKEYKPGPLSGTSDFDTLERAREVLNSYFTLLSSSNVKHWESGRQGYLCTNVALQAYLQLLGSIISYMESDKGLSARELEPNDLISEVEEYMDPILSWLSSASLLQMEKTFKVVFGSGGPREYYFKLCQMIRETISDFSPEGIEEWTEEQSDELIFEADRKLKELNIHVQKTIFDLLKLKYGTAGEAYWNKGITDKKIKLNAYQKSLDDEDEERLPLENYLDFIEYKKIVENKIHWPIFQPLFDIPEPGEKGYSKNVRWMERLNELRRIPAHATEKRSYKTSDFEYIDFIYEEFMGRLKSVDIESLPSIDA